MGFIEFIKDNFLVLSLALTCSGGIIGFFSSRFSQLRNDINKSSERHEERCDKLYQIFAESSERHEARCDKLYQMFIDLLTSRQTDTKND